MYQKSWWYYLQFLRYRAWQTEIVWVIFCPFTPLKTWKIRIKKKWKNYRRCPHFKHVYQKPQSFMVRFLKYGVRRTEFCYFLAIFCPFTPLITWKIKILKKWKIFCHFWASTGPFTPLTTQRIKISKKWRKKTNSWRYYHFTLVYHKWWSYDV